MPNASETEPKSFICPHCGIHSHHTWSEEVSGRFLGEHPNKVKEWMKYELEFTKTALCASCHNFTMWVRGKKVYPTTGTVEAANADLPEDIKAVYNEAKDIVDISPRGSAALLRLSIQKLLAHVGCDGKNINNDILSLIKKGLPAQIQQALDAVRVIGNNAVHPGVIDLNDTPEVATALFGLVNVIADYLISQPKKIAELYRNLPEKDRNNIAKRNGSASVPPSE